MCVMVLLHPNRGIIDLRATSACVIILRVW